MLHDILPCFSMFELFVWAFLGDGRLSEYDSSVFKVKPPTKYYKIWIGMKLPVWCLNSKFFYKIRVLGATLSHQLLGLINDKAQWLLSSVIFDLMTSYSWRRCEILCYFNPGILEKGKPICEVWKKICWRLYLVDCALKEGSLCQIKTI